MRQNKEMTQTDKELRDLIAYLETTGMEQASVDDAELVEAHIEAIKRELRGRGAQY